MEMNNIHSRGGESHIAQQSLRDKLRVHPQNYNDHNLEQLWLHQGQISDLEQLRNFKYGTTSYDHTVFSSEMLSYATKSSQGLLKQHESFDNSATIGNYLSHQNSSCNFNVLADNYAANPSAIFVGGGTNDACASSLHSRPPNCYGYQDIAQSSFAECSLIHQNNPKNIAELHCNTVNTSPLDYENALQQVVPNEELDMIRYGAKDSNELLHFLPSYGDSNSFSSMPVDQPFRQWNNEGVVNKGRDPRGLSLSLSSLPLNRNCPSHFSDLSDTRYTKALKCSNYLCSSSRQSSTGSKGFGYRNIYNVAGPHGPFTGYATILKDSKYLKPTVELLDDLCGSPKQMYPDNINQLGDEFFSVDTNDISGEGGGPNSASESSWPPYQKKKADLLFLQDEVCRRYKQYQQQMQMVVSSFQSVEGVSAATPYISSAVKTISMHFRCLKDTIADQLKHTGKELVEDLSSPTAAGTSSTKGEDGRNYRKQKSSVSNNRNLFEPPQHIWKPQRGLPERAVSVLRAWLFDHFLHPYPTDTDKHMLAIQTGLTRNQVSNWFINARVRIWKPMVKEIHSLETQSLAEKSSHSHTTLDTAGRENHQYHNNQPRTRLYGIESVISDNNVVRNEEYYWNHLQGKLSSGECHNNNIPVSIEGSLMNILPNCQQQQQQGGFGNVSLTLGLRQDYATSHVQQQMHQQEQNGQHF